MRSWRRLGTPALLALASLACARAPETLPAPERGPVEAEASVDRAVATTGDVLTFAVVVDHDAGYVVDVPEAGAEIQGFRIVDLVRDEPVESGGRVVRRLAYRLRADLVGSYVLPSVTVAYRPVGAAEGEVEGVVETSEIFVEVESVLPEDGSAEDIQDLKPLRPIERRRPWWIAVAVALVALAVALWLWRRLRSRRLAPAAPTAPPHEVAFGALDRLRGTDFNDPVAVRRFYFQISELVRVYVEGRFGLNATDLTTEEILARLPTVEALAEPERAQLARFLERTDRVKFAEHRPDEPEIEGVYEDALGFVEATQPRPEPQSDEELAA